jgi:electron transfer flavoprotein alpha subunit
MKVLIIAESGANGLNRESLARTLGAVASLGPADVLVSGAPSDAQDARGYVGVARVLHAPTSPPNESLAEPLAALIAGMAPDYSHIIAGNGAFAKNVMPRLAGLLDVMVIPDVIAVHDDDVFERTVYAGNAVQKLRSWDKIKVVTVRCSSFTAVAEGAAAPIETLQYDSVTPLAECVSRQLAQSERPDLSAARIVVSGGRGLGSRENFALIDALADRLGAAVGASRAAVDNGYASNELQVGQTGRIVAPDIYIAVGISGAIQHLAGMKDSKVIVAINKDEDAPIFQVADFGLLGDLFEAVPDLTRRIA